LSFKVRNAIDLDARQPKFDAPNRREQPLTHFQDHDLSAGWIGRLSQVCRAL
jgi:hypothetical protein